MPDPDARRPLVVGLGNDDRSDDGLGLDVARALAARPGLAADVRLWEGELTGLLELWRGRTRVVLVDAVRSGSAPGEVRRWSAEELADGGSDRTFSTHGIALPAVLELGRSLGRLPQEVVVYGIEAGDTAPGRRRTPEGSSAVLKAVARIEAELGRAAPTGPARAA